MRTIEPPEWQTMDTAPRIRGVEFDVWSPDEGCISDVWWDEKKGHFCYMCNSNDWGEDREYFADAATHWMPKPTK